MLVSRRLILTALAATAATRTASAAERAALPDALELRDLRFPGSFSKRATLLLPRHAPADAKLRLLVLLHGLGETVNERMGAYAWIERYGLGDAYARLLAPPVARTSKRVDVTDERLAAINAELARSPFRGMAIVCPFLPNVNRSGGPSLDEVARFITGTVIPGAREASARIADDDALTEIDGCSLGGYVALEVFLRRPRAFAAWGGVQSAIGAARAKSYAVRIARALAEHGPRALLVETSTRDAFRRGNEALSEALTQRGVAHTLRVLPGPHDQPWLREAGTLEMLLWHDRR